MTDLSKTLFPDWAPPKYPKWLQRMRGDEQYAMTSRFSLMTDAVSQAQNDSLKQLVPIITVSEKWPSALRKEMGKAVWKAYHHATEATNVKRARIWMYFNGAVSWEEIAQIKPVHLGCAVMDMRRAEWSIILYAGSKADRDQYSGIFMLWRDTVRMGLDPNPAWSVKRLKREHDALALEAAMRQHSGQIWAKPFVFEHKGYRFERLISDLDMAQEGLSQRHCVASYTGDAKRGDYVVLRITGKERATFGFGRNYYDELKGFANSEVSKDCRAASIEAKKAYIAQVVTKHKMQGAA